MKLAIGNVYKNSDGEAIEITNITVEVGGDLKVQTQVKISRTESKGSKFVDVVDAVTLVKFINVRKMQPVEVY